MNTDTLFPSKFLKADDAIPALTLTISRVVQETMKNQEQEEEIKPVVYFAEEEKPMVLNRTNCNVLIALYGKETDGWVGKKVILGTDMVTAFGQTKPALRFKNEPIVLDHATLLKRYRTLFETATKEKLFADDKEKQLFTIDDQTPDDAIVEAGKQLRAMVDAANAM